MAQLRQQEGEDYDAWVAGGGRYTEPTLSGSHDGMQPNQGEELTNPNPDLVNGNPSEVTMKKSQPRRAIRVRVL